MLNVLPRYALFFVLIALSSAGLPGLNGFVGEFLVLVGAFQVSPWLAALATTGIVFAAVYLLWMYQRVVFGELLHEENRHLPDLTLREWAILAPVLLLIVYFHIKGSVLILHGETDWQVDGRLSEPPDEEPPLDGLERTAIEQSLDLRELEPLSLLRGVERLSAPVWGVVGPWTHSRPDEGSVLGPQADYLDELLRHFHVHLAGGGACDRPALRPCSAATSTSKPFRL